MKVCPKCQADLAPLIIAMQPSCKVFQFCPCCGAELGYSIKVEVGKVQVMPQKKNDGE